MNTPMHQPRTDWVARLLGKLAAGVPVVRMAVATVKGSAPREPGATLLYWRDELGHTRSWGSIGGGHLEARAMEIAGHLLQADTENRRVQRFSLGASLGQCCGGAVELYWERFDNQVHARKLLGAAGLSVTGLLRYCAVDAGGEEWVVTEAQANSSGLPRPAFAGRAGIVCQDSKRFFVEHLADEFTNLWLYGAGHVGRAMVHVLTDLPFNITWVDSRSEMLADALSATANSASRELHSENPADEAMSAPVGAWHVVMTHSHDQDFEICKALLKVKHFGFLGVLGSRTKATRFRHRLAQQGCSPESVARMICPLGVTGISAKLPAAIAIDVAAQLLRQRERAVFAPGVSVGPNFSADRHVCNS